MRTLVFSLAMLLGGCLTRQTRVEANPDPAPEAYRGPLLAGWVMPAADPLAQELSARLSAELDTAAIFAAVTPLADPRLPNEAEVILTPVLMSTEPLRLRLRAHYKSRGEVALDKEYRVGCRACATGVIDSAAADKLLREIKRDLRPLFARASLE